MNDTKREAWFADLANPDVPLHKLNKSVPHGAKGHDLLDLLHQNEVAIPRAVWFLRVFGGNETVRPAPRCLVSKLMKCGRQV
jgi:mediator of RNA polymerase II transcription subunit 12